jgi:hypothetical protein
MSERSCETACQRRAIRCAIVDRSCDQIGRTLGLLPCAKQSWLRRSDRCSLPRSKSRAPNSQGAGAGRARQNPAAFEKARSTQIAINARSSHQAMDHAWGIPANLAEDVRAAW